MTGRPVWFGPATRPLFGWFHAPPSGRARGGVVICPPFVREHLQAHYALRLLAEQLAAHELVVLRLDYDGMGDSAGDISDPRRVDAWLQSIREGMELVQSAGAKELSLVGMRIGATLAARAAADRPKVAQLVMWDPCESGRSYLREQAAMTAVVLRSDPKLADGGMDTPGLQLREDTVRELEGLRLDRLPGAVASRVLVLTREDRDPATRVMARLGAAVEHREARGQAELMDVGMPWLKIPYRTISEVAGWLAEGAATATPERICAPPPAEAATVMTLPDGRPVVERPVFMPPAGLFGMVTEVPGQLQRGPTAVFVNVANGHHVGPNRMWVDLARRWAAHGLSSVRIDLSGLGESPLRSSSQEHFVARSPEAFEDMADVARAVAPADPRGVVLVGHCASAYQSIESALELGAAGVVAINPVLTFVPPEFERDQPLDGRRRAALPRTPVIEAFHDTGRFASLRERFPRLGWWVRLWSHPRRRPASWLRALARDGTKVLIITGEREFRPFSLGSSRRLRDRLERTGRLRLAHTRDLEHGLLIGRQRQMMADLVTEHVLEWFCPVSPADAQRSPAEHVTVGAPGLVAQPNAV